MQARWKGTNVHQRTKAGVWLVPRPVLELTQSSPLRENNRPSRTSLVVYWFQSNSLKQQGVMRGGSIGGRRPMRDRLVALWGVLWRPSLANAISSGLVCLKSTLLLARFEKPA